MAIKLSISEATLSKQFSFNVHAKELEAAVVKAVATLAGNSTGAKNFSILATKTGKVFVVALGSDTFSLLRVSKAVSTGAGIFGIEVTKLLGVVKNRSDMIFSFTEDLECVFKADKGNYSGKIVTLPITSDMVMLFNDTFTSVIPKGSSAADFTPEILEMLNEGLSSTSIKNVFIPTVMYSYITFTKNHISISTHDTHHFANYSAASEYVGKDFSLSAPITHFQLIDRLVSGYGDSSESIKFTVRNESIRVDTDSFIVVLPIIQSAEKNFSLVTDFIEDSTKPDFKGGIRISELAKIVDNLIPLWSVNTSFDFLHKEKSDKLKITFSSSSGTASDVMSVSSGKAKTVLAKVEPRVFADLIGLIRSMKDTSIHIELDRCIILKATTKLDATVTLICSLN
jgi:hypothetical protein